MDFFVFKKLIGVFLMPVPVILVLLLVSIFFLLRSQQRKALISLSITTILMLMVSLPKLPNTLLQKLEHTYPQFDQSQQVQAIVILGCGHVNDRSLPITSQLRPCSLIRATEAIRIWRQQPTSKILTSGNVQTEPFSNAYMVKQFLISMGVPANQIRAIEKSKDTEEEAKNLSPYLDNIPFALVSSASHLDRAMTLFKKQGLYPIAAPTEHLVRQSDTVAPGVFAPAAQNIVKAERWWYEAMGRSWQWLTND